MVKLVILFSVFYKHVWKFKLDKEWRIDTAEGPYLIIVLRYLFYVLKDQHLKHKTNPPGDYKRL